MGQQNGKSPKAILLFVIFGILLVLPALVMGGNNVSAASTRGAAPLSQTTGIAAAINAGRTLHAVKARSGTEGGFTPTSTRTSTPTATSTRTSTSTVTATPTQCGVNSNYAMATGTATIVPGTFDIGNHTDEGVTFVTLPFAFRLYDQSFTGVNLSPNGTAEFASEIGEYQNTCLPTGLIPTYAIYLNWDDQRTDTTGKGIYTSVTGIAPNRIYNIEWRTDYFDGGEANYELRLYEGSATGRFDTIFGFIGNGNGNATSGVQKNNTLYTQFFCNGGGGIPTSGKLVTYTQAVCGSATVTPTNTAVVATSTSTATNTAVATLTPTRTGTSTNTPTRTNTAVGPTNTAVSTSTNTAVPTSTRTSTNTSTATSTLAPTNTASPTNTLVPTNTSTATNTLVPTNTASPTHTLVPTSTNTSLPTQTPGGPTATDTPTSTATYTASPTSTTAPTNTPVPPTATDTRTNTPAATNTNPPGVTPSSTATTAQATSTATSVSTFTATSTTAPTNTAGAGSPTATICTIEFTDVPSTHTFYASIRCLACRGIINGYSTGCDTGAPCFKPGNNVTRGQLSKIVANAAGFVEPAGAQQFEDVPPSSTFFDFVSRLASRGYVSGYPCGGPGEPCGSGNLPYFRPNANVTRGQLSKIVANAAGFVEPAGAQQFQDVDPSSTFYAFIWRLVDRSIMNGYQCGGIGEPCVAPSNLPYFRTGNNATRGQASKIVANTFFPACDTP